MRPFTRRRMILGSGVVLLGAKKVLAQSARPGSGSIFYPAPTVYGSGGGGGTDADATAWAAAVVANGGTVSAPRLALVSTMISGLKTDGVWTLLDRLWLTAAENTQSALTDMTSNHDLAVNTTCTFTTDRGYIATATPSSRLTTGYNTSTAAQWQQNTAHMMAYCNQSAGVTNNGSAGYDSAVNALLIVKRSSATTNNMGGCINSGSTQSSSPNTSGPVGCNIATRNNDANNINFYFNGASLGTGSASSAAPSNLVMVLCHGAGDSDISNRFAAFSFGGALTAALAAALSTRVTTYLTAIGGN